MAMTLFLIWTLNHPCTHLELQVGTTKGQTLSSKYIVGMVDHFLYEYATRFRSSEVGHEA